MSAAESSSKSSSPAEGSSSGGGGDIMVTRTVSAAARESCALLGGASLVVKAVGAALALSYAASCLSPGAVVRALSVTPGHFWPPHFWIWTAFTHCFLEVGGR